MLARITKLEELEDALKELQARRDELFNADLHTVPHDLESILAAYHLLRAGDVAGASRRAMGGFDKHRKVVELRAELQLRILSAALEAPAQPGENPSSFMLRLASEAQRRKEWRRLAQILEAPERFPSAFHTVDHADRFAVRSFLAGRNLDEAEVWPAAVETYIRTLKTGSVFVPVDEIKQRLAAIRAAHPDDYQRGSDQASAPPPENP